MEITSTFTLKKNLQPCLSTKMFARPPPNPQAMSPPISFTDVPDETTTIPPEITNIPDTELSVPA